MISSVSFMRQAPSLEEKTRRPAGPHAEETVRSGTGRAAGITARQRGAETRPQAPGREGSGATKGGRPARLTMAALTPTSAARRAPMKLDNPFDRRLE
ncbi:MAG: hypothetical protein ACOVPA_08135, partial [Rubrivivax sp.]